MSTSATKTSGRVLDTWTDEDLVYMRLEDGRVIGAPLAWFPRLLAATSDQRAHWEIIPPGIGVSWPDVDEDISVASLLGAETD